MEQHSRGPWSVEACVSIEWLPRRDPDGNGWRAPGRSATAGPPEPGELGELGLLGPIGPIAAIGGPHGDHSRRGVVVPKTPPPPPQFALRRLAWGRIGFPGIMGISWALQGVAHSGWGPGVLAVGVGGVVLYSGGMVVAGSRRTGALALTTTHLHSGDLAVPWGSVEKVVRFSIGTGPLGTPHSLNFLAVRVDDFDNVQGLAPARAGLANLTRRHLLVLAEAQELRTPTAVAAALDYLVANPAARMLLSGAEGVRLLTYGPPQAW